MEGDELKGLVLQFSCCYWDTALLLLLGRKKDALLVHWTYISVTYTCTVSCYDVLRWLCDMWLQPPLWTPASAFCCHHRMCLWLSSVVHAVTCWLTGSICGLQLVYPNTALNVKPRREQFRPRSSFFPAVCLISPCVLDHCRRCWKCSYQHCFNCHVDLYFS